MIVLTSPGAGWADQTVHTQRFSVLLPPAGVAAGHPALRNGHPVDVHPRGPGNGAQERYVSSGATLNTAYEVVPRVFTDAVWGPRIRSLTSSGPGPRGRIGMATPMANAPSRRVLRYLHLSS